MWLGHESMDTTQMYLHANIELKEKALAKTEPFRGQHRRCRPPDQLLAFPAGALRSNYAEKGSNHNFSLLVPF
jgi:hypothetical protein